MYIRNSIKLNFLMNHKHEGKLDIVHVQLSHFLQLDIEN